jgi:hypothetical protein
VPVELLEVVPEDALALFVVELVEPPVGASGSLRGSGGPIGSVV